MRKASWMMAACAALVSTAALSQTGGKLTMVEAVGVRSAWDMASDDAYLGTRAGCYETLTTVGFDGQLKPLLAATWKQADANTWEFTLREGVKFHDGTPLNAETAANALNQLMKAAVPARAFSNKFVKSVEAVGDKTVRITTLEPSVLLPGQVAAPATTILAPAAYKDGKINPINTCTGPFTITRVDPTQGMSLKRNDAYWGEKAALATAEVKFIPDGNGRATQIRTGEGDISRMVLPATLSQLKAMPNVKLAEVPVPRTLSMLLNNKKAPLDDVRVRQAIQAAIDNAAIGAAVYEGTFPAAMGPFRPGDPWAPKDQKPTYDVEKAKKLLADAGIKPGTLKLRLWGYVSRAEMKDVGAIVQEMLSKVGITVELRMAEYNAIEPDMLAGNFDMAFMSRGYLTDVPEPIGFLSADYSCTGSFNMAHYCNPAFDAEIKKALTTPDLAQRLDIYKKLGAQIQAEAINIFLVHESIFDAYSTKVKNYQPHPLNYFSLTPSVSVN